MRQRTRWKLFWCLFQILPISFQIGDFSKTRNGQKSLFSPRMDYNQWKPLGRGDPLKNDPTFDYVPPVLDQVHYWMEPENFTGDVVKSPKSEILLLGVASKKPALHQATDRKDYDYNHRYNPYPNQRVARPNYFPSSVTSSLMSLANRVLDKTLLFSKNPDRAMPYTVLMPPPMISNGYATSPMTQKPKTSVTIEESNLIYQSSSNVQSSSKEFESLPSINWELSPGSTTETALFLRQQENHLVPPKSFIRIQFSPANYTGKILEGADSNHNINYVTPPPLDDSQMTFRGQVRDDNHISDSYVKIEKPQAHMGIEINNVHPIVFGNQYRPIMEMETLQPPPVTQNPVYTKNVLKKEQLPVVVVVATTTPPPLPPPTTTSSTTPTTTAPTTTTLATTTDPVVTTVQTLTTDPLFKHYKQPAEPLKGPLYLIIQGHSKVKTYKPAKQIDGIMIQETNEIPYTTIDYDIKHLHGYEPKEDFVKKSEEIARRRQARTGNLQTLKHVAQTGLGAIDFAKEEVDDDDDRLLRRRNDEGAIDFVKEEEIDDDDDRLLRRRNDEVRVAEVRGTYGVANRGYVATERYVKGSVEAARKLN